MLKALLLVSPIVLILLSALPKLLIQRRDVRLNDAAIDEYRDSLVETHREPTFEERWDASDDEFMKRWSSFCSRDLSAENDDLVHRTAYAMAEVIDWAQAYTVAHVQGLACDFIGVRNMVELEGEYLAMRADGNFDFLREHADPLDDTTVWTEEMEQELRVLLAEGVKV